MRVTHLSMFRQGINSISSTQNEVVRLQTQVSTGKKIFSPSEDPFAATRSLQLTRAIDELDQYQRNADHADHRLSLEDDVMSQVVNTLQRVNELAVQANNDSENAETRGFIAVELKQLRTQLVELANAGDGEGNFLFAGFRSGTQPFVDEGGTVSYRGDQGQRQLQIGPTRTVADGDSGAAVFQQIQNGNGTFVSAADVGNNGTGILQGGSVLDPALWDGDNYEIVFTSDTDYEVLDSGGAVVQTGVYVEPETVIAFAGVEIVLAGTPATNDRFTVGPSTQQDLFATVQNFIDALESPEGTESDRAILHNRLNGVLSDLDQSFSHLSSVRAGVGSRLNAVDNQRALNSDTGLLLQATLSDVEDVDLVEAIGELDLQLQALEAAQQSFVAVQQLSLFSFL